MQTHSQLHTRHTWPRLFFTIAIVLLTAAATARADDYSNARARLTSLMVGTQVSENASVVSLMVSNCSTWKAYGGTVAWTDTNQAPATAGGNPFPNPGNASALLAFESNTDTSGGLALGKFIDPTTKVYSQNTQDLYLKNVALNLLNMATAYQSDYDPNATTPASPAPTCYHSSILAQNVIYGLNYLETYWYTSTGAIKDNANETIGDDLYTQTDMPKSILKSLVLVYSSLSDADLRTAVLSMEASIDQNEKARGCCDQSGANWADVVLVKFLEGIVSSTYSYIDTATSNLTQVMNQADNGNLKNVPKSEHDSMHADYSYIQHAVTPYTAGYGSDYLGNIIDIYYITLGPGGTAASWYANMPPNPLIAYVMNGYVPLIYNGNIMSMVAGRYVGRETSGQEDELCSSVVSEMLTVASLLNRSGDSPDVAAATTMQEYVKYWVSAAPAGSLRTTSSYNTTELYDTLASSTTISAVEPPDAHSNFYNMDRVTHTRQKYAFGIAMSSTRVNSWESLAENPSGFHSGDGMTYLYTDDPSQFSSIINANRDHAFWPTVDPYKMPGATTITQSCDEQNTSYDYDTTIGGNDWVGGSTLGIYGTAGMSINPLLSQVSNCSGYDIHQTLVDTADYITGFKSWFMFDNEIVALGAGITSNQPSVTTVENRKLAPSAPNTFFANGYSQSTAIPSSNLPFASQITNAWLQGNSLGTLGIGYYFPGGVSLYSKRVQNGGSWNAYNGKGGTGSVAADYQTLYLDHGTPSNASYEYVMLPNISESDTEAYAAHPEVYIMSNTSTVQAVQQVQTGVVGANFWAGGNVYAHGNQTPLISSDSPASVTYQLTSNGSIYVAVSDPTHLATAPITITINVNVTNAAVSVQDGVTVTNKNPLTLSVAVNNTTDDYQGRSYLANFVMN